MILVSDGDQTIEAAEVANTSWRGMGRVVRSCSCLVSRRVCQPVKTSVGFRDTFWVWEELMSIRYADAEAWAMT